MLLKRKTTEKAIPMHGSLTVRARSSAMLGHDGDSDPATVLHVQRGKVVPGLALVIEGVGEVAISPKDLDYLLEKIEEIQEKAKYPENYIGDRCCTLRFGRKPERTG